MLRWKEWNEARKVERDHVLGTEGRPSIQEERVEERGGLLLLDEWHDVGTSAASEQVDCVAHWLLRHWPVSYLLEMNESLSAEL